MIHPIKNAVISNRQTIRHLFVTLKEEEMKIKAFDLYHVSVPLRATFWPTWIPGYPQTHNRFTLIRIVTDEGIEGFSAGSAMGKEREGLGDLLGG